MMSSAVQVEFSQDEKDSCITTVKSFLHNYALLLKKAEEVPLPVSRDSPEMVMQCD
jgi:hypothetical protein